MNKKKIIIFIGYTFFVAFVVFSFFRNIFGMRYESSYDAGYSDAYVSAPSFSSSMSPISQSLSSSGSSKSYSSNTRMSTQENYVSLFVKNVSETFSDIELKVQELNGYVVYKNLSAPTEGGSGTIEVRIPREASSEFLDFVKGTAIKVLFVNESGNDITEAYADYQRRISNLEETMILLKQAQQKATLATEIADISLQISQIQEQIDNVKGQEQYLKQASLTTVIRISAQTDEYALPYNPQDTWSPEKVFKNAVRSLVMFTRSIGSGLIWLAVYSPVILAFGVIAIVVKKVINRNNKAKK